MVTHVRVTIFYLQLLQKKEDCLPTTQSLLNLKSNTMKNTVQR